MAKPRMHRKSSADTGPKKSPARKPLGNGNAAKGAKPAFLRGKRNTKKGGTS